LKGNVEAQKEKLVGKLVTLRANIGGIECAASFGELRLLVERRA
jgi:hypothetical protein